MSAQPRVTPAGASLLEADPALARALGPSAAARVGHDRILPVLSVAAGQWEPPPRRLLGTGTVAVVVLDGLLVGTDAPAAVIGPGDVLDPWEPAERWTACTPLRLALIGTHFMEALHAWPSAAAHVLARAARPAVSPGDDTIDERVVALLWRIAGRWGTPDGEVMALPVTVDRRVVAALLHLPEPAIAAAVARIAAGGTLVARERAGWQLSAAVPGATSPGHSRERRDDLRARSARQIAISRGARADYVSVSRQIHDQLARRRQHP